MNRLNRIYNELTPRQHKKFDDKIKLIRQILEQREKQAQIIRAKNRTLPKPPPTGKEGHLRKREAEEKSTPTEPRSGDTAQSAA